MYACTLTSPLSQLFRPCRPCPVLSPVLATRPPRIPTRQVRGELMVVDFSRTTRTPRRRFANESHVLPVYCLGNWRPLEHTWPYGCIWCFRPAWKPKQPETNGCSTMAIEILYIGNGCLGKHPFVSGCLVSQAGGFLGVDEHRNTSPGAEKARGRSVPSLPSSWGC